jgi:CRISPR-associated protein Csm1
MNFIRACHTGGLLHDIGKFIERGKLDDLKKQADEFLKNYELNRKYAHRRYSALFADLFKDKPFINGEIWKSVLYHHAAEETSRQYHQNDLHTKIVRIADDLASAERKETSETYNQQVSYERVRLASILSRINHEDSRQAQPYQQWKYHKPTVLNLQNNVFATENEIQSAENEYSGLVQGVMHEMQHVNNENQLLALLEKYTWAIPSATPWGDKSKVIPDISLYDHSRVTAAIAACMAYEVENKGTLTKKDIFQLHSQKTNGEFILQPDEIALKEPFILVQGDFSGIQSFIFDIVQHKAAKSLKARSYYLQMLSEVIVRYIIDHTGVFQTSILYNGGGNFYLLLPASATNNLVECHRRITEVLLKAHQGRIYLALGKEPVSFSDFMDFGQKWKDLAERTSEQKTKRFEEIDYQNVFSPFASQSHKKEDNPIYQSLQEDFSKQFRDSNTLCFEKVKAGQADKYETYQEVFRAFGYKIHFTKETNQDQVSNYILNNTNFRNFDGFAFSVNQLGISDFEEMAENFTQGSEKLALLKMDVDNLGKIFIQGIPENERNISRIVTLSRNFTLFFEGYINTIIDQKKYIDEQGNRLIYVIYSGGDDTLLIGPYNLVIDLAKDIKDEFDSFACNNPQITLSAAISIIDKTFPLLHAANLAEKQLEDAKNKDEGKNKISIMGEVFTWREYTEMLNMKNQLYKLITSENQSKKESRALLQKILNSTKGFKHLMENSANKNLMDIQKVWRFRYYLRTMKAANNEEKEQLISWYENILLHNTLNEKNEEKIENIMILPVACKLTEYLTKTKYNLYG